MNTFLKMLRDESGASAAEYALILALVGTGIAIAAFNLGNAITGTINNSTACIDGISTLPDDKGTEATDDDIAAAC